MEKLCRTLTLVQRLPKLGHIRAVSTNINYVIKPQPAINQLWVRQFNSGKPSTGNANEQLKLVDILEREISDESAELSQHLSTDQFPGFSVETDDADVKLTKQVGDSTVTVRFTVSSSLADWSEPQSANQEANEEDTGSKLVSMPEFQVQISKNNQTLELSCFFEEADLDEETGSPQGGDPVFGIEELVIYTGEPKDSEFAVSAEYFQEDLQVSMLQYLAEYGIDDNFAKDLVAFATSYEKKQYISLMQRLKNFISTK